MIELCQGNIRFETIRGKKTINLPAGNKDWQKLDVAQIQSAQLDFSGCNIQVKLLVEDMDPNTCEIMVRQRLGHQLPLFCPRIFSESTLSS